MASKPVATAAPAASLDSLDDADVKAPALKSAASVGGLTAAPAASSGTLQLAVKLDFPAKLVFVKVDAKTPVVALKAQCAGELGIKESELKRYEFRSVALGTNVTLLGGQKAGDAATLSEEGVQNRGTILVTAPADVKPVRVFEVKKKADGDDDDDDDAASNKYKGLKPSTIVKVMGMAKGRDELVALEFFDMHAAKAVRSPDWLALDSKQVTRLVQRNTLNIREGDLFEAVVAWGRAECKRQGLDAAKTDDLRKVLGGIVGHIRFPCMAMEEVATKVTPTNVLTGEQMLQVFTYLGLTKDKASKMKMPYPTVPRAGRRPPHWFAWDPTAKHYSLQLSDKNMCVGTNDAQNWQNCGATTELKKGVHEWECVLQQYDQQNGYNVVIGVVPSYWNNWSYASWIGASQQAPGWAFITGNGYKTCANGGQQYYGQRAATTGDVIKCRLDLTQHTLEFFVNGASQGVAFHDVYGPVRAAISLCRPQKVLLRFPAGSAAAAQSGDD